jgi:hypothetical protein
MSWLILLFYPEPEARDKIYKYPPTHRLKLKTHFDFHELFRF